MQTIPPYNTPDIECTAPKDAASNRRGRPCPACGSVNTVWDALLLSQPSILLVLLFGWVSLLVRGAFAVRTVRCSDCGAVNRYKTVGSWIAMAVLIFLLLCIIAAVTTDDYQ